MNFSDGASRTSKTQQLIAFWKYTIDTYAYTLEQGVEIDDSKDPLPLQGTGCDTEESFHGAVRSGFLAAIDTLPQEARQPVCEYLYERVILMRKRVPEDIIDDDIIFGTGPRSDASASV